MVTCLVRCTLVARTREDSKRRASKNGCSRDLNSGKRAFEKERGSDRPRRSSRGCRSIPGIPDDVRETVRALLITERSFCARKHAPQSRGQCREANREKTSKKTSLSVPSGVVPFSSGDRIRWWFSLCPAIGYLAGKNSTRWSVARTSGREIGVVRFHVNALAYDSVRAPTSRLLSSVRSAVARRGASLVGTSVEGGGDGHGLNEWRSGGERRGIKVRTHENRWGRGLRTCVDRERTRKIEGGSEGARAVR